MKCTVRKVEIVEYRLDCPYCKAEGEHNVTYMFKEAQTSGKKSLFGPRYCDKCGDAIKGDVLPDGTVELEEIWQKKIPTLVALGMERAGEDPLILIVKGTSFYNNGKPVTDLHDGNRYFYEEHTCPTNYFGSTEVIISGDDADPHGLFCYIDTVELDYDTKARIMQMTHDGMGEDMDSALNNMDAKSILSLFNRKRILKIGEGNG